jgi:putative nucleotidyltransferase with HDIG domain
MDDMRVELSFLRSRLGHRIFWLFVVCALLPISLLALVTWLNVTTQLREQSHRQLAQLSREEAMTVFERLRFLEDSLKLLAAEQDLHSAPHRSAELSVLSSNLVDRFNGVQLLLPGGKSELLFGKAPWQIEFTDEQEKFLGAGKSVVFTVSCEQPTPCILLGRRLNPVDPSLGTLAAEINPSYLWGEDELPADANVCVLDATGRTLFCSGQAPSSFPLLITKARSGEFDWNSGRTPFMAQYWTLSLGGTFCTPHWTMIASQPSPDALGPLVHFRSSLILVFLLTVWIVLLLSMVQIRRNLVPLAKLKEGTRGISQGNYKERVIIGSGDEFEELAGSFNIMAGRIEKQLNSLKTFNEIDRAILSAWEIDKIVDTVSTRLGDLIPLEAVAISLFDSEDCSSAYCYVYERGRKPLRAKEKFPPSPDELLQLHQHPEVSVFGENEPLPSYVRPLRTAATKFFLRAPVLLDGRPAAVICLSHSSASVWNDEDKQSMRQLADQVGVALTNLQLVRKLNQLHWGALAALARAIDAKSPWTLGHSERVTELAIKLAEEMRLPAQEIEVIRRGGLVHDVGKIGVAAEILNKPGKLTPDELQQMRDHVNIGVRILQPIREFAESMSLVAQHHEWVNGQGYPNGLIGGQISLHARILAVADCFDALVSDRPYRAGMPLPTVIRMISDGAGTQFDPQIVDVFRRVMAQENAPMTGKNARTELQVS